MDGIGGRRRISAKSSAEDQALDQIAKEAEARLWAKRQARAEARDIRMRELERQQKEQEENADRQFDMLSDPTSRSARPGNTGSRYLSSRRSSEDSLEDGCTGSNYRELRHEFKELEEKFRKTMITNAQLDNDKTSQTYQLELLKDKLEDNEQEYAQLKKEYREKCREYEQFKRVCAKLRDDLAVTQNELAEKDLLISEKGLVVVTIDDPSICVNDDNTGNTNGEVGIYLPKKALVTAENANLLESAGSGSLDVRLDKFAKERSELQDQVSHLKLELEEERNKKRRSNSIVTDNGPSSDLDDEDIENQREASWKQLDDYKWRAQRAEQNVESLQAYVARLESQVIRYKSEAEMSEKSEEALKSERRKLQREVREAQSRVEELETSNTHLMKRLDKLKNAKSALFREH